MYIMAQPNPKPISQHSFFKKGMDVCYHGVRIIGKEGRKKPRTKRSGNVVMNEHGSNEFDVFQTVLEQRPFHLLWRRDTQHSLYANK